MNFKEKWTRFWWNVFLPNEPYDVPVELKNKTTDPLDALTQLICMDITSYPSTWRRYSTMDSYRIIENSEANIKIKSNMLHHTRPNQFCLVNDIEVGAERGTQILNAWNNRNLATVIEKLLDRVQQVETVSFEEVKEEVRPKVVDPFMQPRLEQLQAHITRLQQAEAEAKKLLPPPVKKRFSTTPTKIYTKSTPTYVGRKPIYGKTISDKLRKNEFRQIMYRGMLP